VASDERLLTRPAEFGPRIARKYGGTSMSLSDRYNRGDSWIQKCDKYLTDTGNRVGNFWLDQTGINRRTLTQGLYIAAVLAASERAIVFHDPTMFVMAAVAMMSYMGLGQSKGGVVEQIQAEAAGLPKNTLAWMRLEILVIGVWMLASAGGGFVALLHSNQSIAVLLIKPLMAGIAFTALQAGDYISRTNPASPGKGGRGKLSFNPR